MLCVLSLTKPWLALSCSAFIWLFILLEILLNTCWHLIVLWFVRHMVLVGMMFWLFILWVKERWLKWSQWSHPVEMMVPIAVLRNGWKKKDDEMVAVAEVHGCLVWCFSYGRERRSHRGDRDKEYRSRRSSYRSRRRSTDEFGRTRRRSEGGSRRHR